MNKRLSSGIALGANYQYSHSIDDASSAVQNWQDLAAEEGNSTFDQRHKVSGTYLYELPFGKDKFWVTSGAGAHILEGFSVSGSFTFATGTPLTPYYPAAVSDVAHGMTGTLRPDPVAGYFAHGRRRIGEGVVQYGGLSAAQARQFRQRIRQASRATRSWGRGRSQNNMSLSKTMQLGDTRSMEVRATANNVFNTVQYAGVDTNLTSPTAGQVISAAAMRSFSLRRGSGFEIAELAVLAALRAMASWQVRAFPVQNRDRGHPAG